MSEPDTVDEDRSTAAAAPADGGQATGEAGKDDKPKQKPGIIRWAGIIVLLVLVVIVGVTAWFIADPLVVRGINSSVKAVGYQFGEETVIDSDIFAGRIAIDQLALDQRRSGDEVKRLIQGDKVEVDIGLGETLLGNDVVLDRLAIENLGIVMRRYKDGSVPDLTGEAPGEVEATDEVPPEEQPTDWVELYEKSKKWKERLSEWLGGDEAEAAAADKPQPKKVDPANPEIVHYLPKPTPGGDSHTPRTIIRALAITGAKMSLPQSLEAAKAGQETGSPFDIADATINGVNVTRYLREAERMQLDGKAATAAAGAFIFKLARGVSDGTLELDWAELPLETLRDPAVAGEKLAAYGMGGMAAVDLDAAWKDGVLDGEIVLDIVGLVLQPSEEAGPDAQQAAKLLTQFDSQARKLNDGKPLPLQWRIGVHGKGDDITFTGGGMDGLQASIKKAIADLAKRQLEGFKEAGKEQLKEATESGKAAGKEMLEGMLKKDDGKSTEETGDGEKSGEEEKKDAGDQLKDKLKGFGL